MEGWRGGSHVAAFLASGNNLITDPDTREPFLLPAEGHSFIGVLPARSSPQEHEYMVAWLICEIAQLRLGRAGYLSRLVAYGRVAALGLLLLLAWHGTGHVSFPPTMPRR